MQRDPCDSYMKFLRGKILWNWDSVTARRSIWTESSGLKQNPQFYLYSFLWGLVFWNFMACVVLCINHHSEKTEPVNVPWDPFTLRSCNKAAWGLSSPMHTLAPSKHATALHSCNLSGQEGCTKRTVPPVVFWMPFCFESQSSEDAFQLSRLSAAHPVFEAEQHFMACVDCTRVASLKDICELTEGRLSCFW